MLSRYIAIGKKNYYVLMMRRYTPARLNPLPAIKKGDVIQDIETKKIMVVGVGIKTKYVLDNINNYIFLSDVPHSDGDYDHCKCMQ